MGKNIAVDGPAGAGKSTIAKKVAAKLGLIYVDTGAMYRAIALYMIRNHVDGQKEDAVNEACEHIEVSIQYVDGEQQVLLNGENVNGYIRKEEVGNMASVTSSYPKVRAMLLDAQQELARKQDVIMDGRDIGTCVLPDAALKIYLTASVETRAKRRYDELVEKGASCDIKEIEKDIEQRDYQDMNRKISPLKQAEDAVLVDSSDMSIDEVTNTIIQYYQER
ncbi:MAG: (d)CMP kinase [Eubacterium sp.]|nr:(d)CMP kinase [Eubacterium sp.]